MSQESCTCDDGIEDMVLDLESDISRMTFPDFLAFLLTLEEATFDSLTAIAW